MEKMLLSLRFTRSGKQHIQILRFGTRPPLTASIAEQKCGSRFLCHQRPLANSDMMSTLTTHCQWEDETVRERTGHPPSYSVARKMKWLTLHPHGCLRVSLKD